MDEKKASSILLERIKYFLNAIENGEYAPTKYEFTIKLFSATKSLTIEDKDTF